MNLVWHHIGGFRALGVFIGSVFLFILFRFLFGRMAELNRTQEA